MSDRSPGDREALLEDLAEQYLDDLQAGETPDRSALLAAHPDIASALDRRLSLIEAMHRLAHSRPRDAAPPEADDRAIRVRCPHCDNPIQLVEPRAREFTCPACGSSFPADANATASYTPELFPRSLGKFQVLGVLGRGTFGTVYKALDPDLGRTVAVKVPRAGSFATVEEEERFLREARHAAQLNHPGIVKILEIDRERGMPYIVSDFIAGPTLAELLNAARPGYRESADLIARIADALSHAHTSGIIHRNIKPSNILLDPAGRPLVTDFGLARREEAETVVTLDGQILGTPAYMSPEQASGDQARVGPRSDVYSLGVVLYVLLTGEPPFRGNSRMLIHQLLHDDPKPPRSLDDKVPRELETICLKAMAKEPAKRYASADELAGDLRRFLKGEPIRARRIGRIERTWRWCRRKPLVTSLIGGIAASLISGTFFSTIFAKRAIDRAEDARKNLYVARSNFIQIALEKGRVDHARGLLDQQRPRGSESDLRGWEWFYQDRLSQGDMRTLHERLKGSEWGKAIFSPDGRLVALTGRCPTSIFEVSTGKKLRTFEKTFGLGAFSPDGESFAVPTREHSIIFIPTDTFDIQHTMNTTFDFVSVRRFTPDGSHLLLTHNGDVLFKTVDTGTDSWVFHPYDNLGDLDISPDGLWLATCPHDQKDDFVKIWDITI